ncbi:MAG: hypothetical protein EZS28_009673 [Streblomastix strix]|uniref:Uncharacterized protein n=1 Tax=Streblomastix strix TaxID=222440 RepID=A0A5J4WI99_9EUKA|nr:MAG: hypothetical protein EZS28_009673 [Streblomastix strix]
MILGIATLAKGKGPCALVGGSFLVPNDAKLTFFVLLVEPQHILFNQKSILHAKANILIKDNQFNSFQGGLNNGFGGGIAPKIVTKLLRVLEDSTYVVRIEVEPLNNMKEQNEKLGINKGLQQSSTSIVSNPYGTTLPISLSIFFIYENQNSESQSSQQTFSVSTEFTIISTTSDSPLAQQQPRVERGNFQELTFYHRFLMAEPRSNTL